MKDEDNKLKELNDEREALCRELMEMIKTRSEELAGLGFSPEMARFDCLMTVKIIVDELYDEFNVGHARQEWYREYVKTLMPIITSD